MAVPPAVEASHGRWDPCASGTRCGLELCSPSCILLGCAWETDGGLSPVWEEQGTVLYWSPGGARDLGLHLLTTSLSQGTLHSRDSFVEGPLKLPADQSVTHLGFRVTWCGVAQGGEERARDSALSRCRPPVPNPVFRGSPQAVAQAHDSAACLLCLAEYYLGFAMLTCWAGPR